MKKRKKNILFLILMLLLVLPALQQFTGIFNVRELDGDFVLNEKPDFSDSTWMDGSFQRNYNNYIEDHIGFRSFIIRVNNTLDFYAYKNSNADGVVVGKNNFLYEYDYIRAMQGEDFIGERTLNRKLRRLKFLQEYLKETKGIDILLCFEPSKARFYSEYLPKNNNKKKVVNTNYDYLIKITDSLNINHIDLNKYFLTLKGKTQYPLFPKYGTHWSNYGATIGIDTIFKRIEEISGTDYRDIIVDDYNVSKTPLHPDYDIGKASNLLWMLAQEDLANPVLSFSKDLKKDKLLVIGDSFYWNIYNMRIQDSLFNKQNFWYFNAMVYPDHYIKPSSTNDLNLRSEIEQRDVILISITERFLRKFAWGFIDKLYQQYGLTYGLESVINIENDILKNDRWFESLINTGKKNNEQLSEVIKKNAEYVFLTKNKEKYLELWGLQYYESIIRKDRNWYQKIVDQSKEQNVDFDTLLKQNAEYIFKEKEPQLFKKYTSRVKSINSLKSDKQLERLNLMKKYYLNEEEAINIYFENIR